jgi:uncharacterized protein YjbI with pentapeptide repeats
MANEEQLSILKQGVDVWNKWRLENSATKVDLREVDLIRADLREADLVAASLHEANLSGAKLSGANLCSANLSGATLMGANLSGAKLQHSVFTGVRAASTLFVNLDLSRVIGLDNILHRSSSTIGTDTFARSLGKIPEVFLRGCGLPDWEIESVKLHNPDLGNEDVNKILYRIFDLRATQAIQISPLYISYSHADHSFVDKIEIHLKEKGIRFWRDIHGLKAGRMEKQFDRAMRQNPTVLLILSSNSIKSDWVEHEVRMARGLEKEMERDVLCPVALDESWKSSPWPKRIMEQIMEYNILDFSAWEDESKFDGTFRKLIDGLELFYKG